MKENVRAIEGRSRPEIKHAKKQIYKNDVAQKNCQILEESRILTANQASYYPKQYGD